MTEEKESEEKESEERDSEEKETEGKKSEKRKSQYAQKSRKVAKYCVFPMFCGSRGSKVGLPKRQMRNHSVR